MFCIRGKGLVLAKGLGVKRAGAVGFILGNNQNSGAVGFILISFQPLGLPTWTAQLY